MKTAHLLFVVLSDCQVEGERSVLLPCLYSGFIPEDSTVIWTLNDLVPKPVHLRGKGGDDLNGQIQQYKGRTSMNPYALITKDFTLTLRRPTKTDSGNYTCSISAGESERRLRSIQLHIKGQTLKPAVLIGQTSVLQTKVRQIVLQVKGQCCKLRSEVNVVDTGQSNFFNVSPQNHFHPGP
uniref:Ig-like domain-containing protein n=1 Tax=Haplochromis burtoni TaxID=8153 RepID=A0A3Q3CAP0_HAPBU